MDGTTFRLEPPFLVMATQNPLESGGTFPLPEAQVDRFFMRLSLGYMERSQEIEVLGRRSAVSLIDDIEPVVTKEETEGLRAALDGVEVNGAVADYIMDIVEATRNAGGGICGVSTRGAIALYRASKALAALSGRSYVIPEDVREMAAPVLAHRISGGISSAADGERFINRILTQVQVPLEK